MTAISQDLAGNTSTWLALVITTALATWIWAAHPNASGSATATATVLVVGLAFALGALAAQAHPALPGAMVAAAVMIAIAFTLPLSLSGDQSAPPMGYGNANGALLVAGTAGGLVATSRVSDSLRPLAWSCAALLAALTVFTASVAATVSSLLLMLLWSLRHYGRSVTWTLIALALVAVPVLVTVALAYQAMPVQSFFEGLLSPARLDLWSDAASMVEAHPLAGVGPGRFSEMSTVALIDPDLDRAHSGPLQVAATLGLVGAGLLGLLVLWLLLSLRREAVLVGAFALTASIDYVMDFLWVTLAMAVVLGGAWMSARAADHGLSEGTGLP